MDRATCEAAPDASVVIPAFRAAEFIHRAIDSALGQKGLRLEVIVVDDACPLGTANAVEARYHGVAEVRVVRLPENQGPSGARNVGFRAALGEWVAVLDADDAFDEGRLARLVERGRRLGADVVADNVRFFNALEGTLSEPRITSVTAPEWIDLHTLVARGRPGTGELDYGLLKPLFRRTFVLAMPELYPTNIRHGEDFLFYIRLIRAGAGFLVVPEPGYQWTLRSSGQSQTREDYLGQAADIRALKMEAGLREDATLVKLFEERARALTRLHHQRRFDAHLRNRRVLRVLTAAARHPFLAKKLVGLVRRKGR